MEIYSLDELNNLSKDIPNIIIKFKISKLIIPEHILDIECFEMEINEIICNDKLEFLYCPNNNIKSIIIPDNLLYLNISNNKLENIYVNNTVNCLHQLDISYNNITDFTLKLPKTIETFYIKGNVNIRIKHWNFIFRNNSSLKIIYTDIDEIIFNGELKNNYKLLDRLDDLHEILEYITYEDITKKWNKHYKNISYDQFT